jgi:hypothetical protein
VSCNLKIDLNVLLQQFVRDLKLKCKVWKREQNVFGEIEEEAVIHCGIGKSLFVLNNGHASSGHPDLELTTKYTKSSVGFSFAPINCQQSSPIRTSYITPRLRSTPLQLLTTSSFFITHQPSPFSSSPSSLHLAQI